ncbi:hypothetical protein EUBHAL_01683 [Anaerobutyricum hallii DSM 3353]|uniref:Uncharacterized protein n=1 Tax=Anaerobutyricum hallii DSM 3353 TaxID=411469 RepID=C0EW95_9FIRM|nr:hypothetical protein EUBHAL_01683 [Anaerobutyricum hallii DSM 3353]
MDGIFRKHSFSLCKNCSVVINLNFHLQFLSLNPAFCFTKRRKWSIMKYT